ncbi:hydroxymethylbilane synthase [Chlamydia sp. 17-3921]|uniref:hydroxymethylbilane synthase n=1 Tax=Chlamydia sp. 17-3921 TaxID=2675798 RepID=UPI001917FCF2|nr:hydroxymethylbilane synthase [Chlamydia sp. 17-3921]
MPSSSSANSLFQDLRAGKASLKIASRSSALAKAQVYECVDLLKKHYPALRFELITTTTKGDRDKKTSLRLVENSNFFTKDVDDLVSQGKCHIAIHSAKDLPAISNLPIVAITQSLHPADLLIYANRHEGYPPPSLNLRLGSSSIRRAETLKKLFPLGQVLDIRGTIEERLQQLEDGKYDAIVLAKAAALRLHLTFSCSQELPPPYHPLQGCLAITARYSLDLWTSFLSPLHNTYYSNLFLKKIVLNISN